MSVDSCFLLVAVILVSFRDGTLQNVRGGPGDEDPMPPPGLSAQQKEKAKKTTKKKRKRDDVETERAAAVAATVERAEKGGSGSGIHIGHQLSLA